MRDSGERAHQATFEHAKEGFTSDVPWIAEAYRKAKREPGPVLYKLKSNSYKWSWAIIPLSVPFVWLLFPFSRRFRLYDHTVFVTYSLCVHELCWSPGRYRQRPGSRWSRLACSSFRQSTSTGSCAALTSCGRWGALWRTLVLVIVAVIVLILFVLSMWSR